MPREPGNLLKLRSGTSKVNLQSGEDQGPPQSQGRAARGCGTAQIARIPAKLGGAGTTRTQMRTEQCNFAQGLKSLKKFFKNVIPEQIPFLPGLSAPSGSATTRVPPLFPDAPPLATFIKKKKKRNVAESLSPSISKAWKLEEIQIKLVAH